MLPYRPLQVPRLQAYLDSRGKGESERAPPPDTTEAGCLRRAWARFQHRLPVLREAFGQMLKSCADNPASLWRQIRQAKGSLEEILDWLARTRNISLLRDYHCLRLPVL